MIKYEKLRCMFCEGASTSLAVQTLSESFAAQTL